MASIDAEFRGQMRAPSLVIWLVAATMILFVVWAKFAWIDEIVKAEGEVVSAARPQIIQNLEGGILAELLVREGDLVQPGQVMARLRDTQFRAAVDDLQEQLAAAQIRQLRLEAEMAGESTFTVPADLAAVAPEIAESEQTLLAARQADYQSQVDGAQSILTETQRELAVMEDLLKREIAALVEVTRARKANTDAQNVLNEIVTGAQLARASDYSDVLSEIGTLKQELRLAQDQLARTVIISPMRGIVNAVGVATIGGVIRPGEDILTIIPDGDQLFVEARVRPADIANVVAGQQAMIKLTAYDYTIYGSIPGEVTFISADTFDDERRADLPPHYKVTLTVDLSQRTDRQQGIEIRPGMQATVELYTGKKTVLQYLTKPLYRGSEALREP
ncbi:MAG: HlyD family efflux transporter periplasmic adaptor subunit [Rhodobacterales bacterium]|nr:HlyD family efflux transporter periplasmic adaptor subunit [Rhodobacterales bacterium]